MYTIYAHINKRNGKTYVGMTSQKPQTRWQSGGGYKSNKPFTEDIKKFGWDAFDHVIVAQTEDETEADTLEATTITRFKATNPKFGYNILEGGRHAHKTPEVRERMRQAHLAKPLSEEHKMKLAKANMKPVTCLDTKTGSLTVYKSAKEAAEKLGVDFTAVSRVCNLERKHTKGFHFCFVENY